MLYYCINMIGVENLRSYCNKECEIEYKLLITLQRLHCSSGINSSLCQCLSTTMSAWLSFQQMTNS